VRRPPPPAGWYLPELAARRAELDSIDIVEGLAIKDGPYLEVLNAVSLHGGLVGSWPHEGAVTAVWTVEALIEHWRDVGLPSYAQFDNDTIFTGPHTHPDTVGRVMRLCLGLGIVPVFVPPRETGFQAMIEGYNGLWQAKVWARFTFTTPAEVRQQSGRFVAAVRSRRAERIETARPVVPSPRTGGWTCRPILAGASASCAARTPAGPCACWDAAMRSIRGGPTAWSARSSTSKRARSAPTRCVGRSRRPSPGSGRSIIGCRDVNSKSDREVVSLAIA
jgi:hypothetical protein